MILTELGFRDWQGPRTEERLNGVEVRQIVGACERGVYHNIGHSQHEIGSDDQQPTTAKLRPDHRTSPPS